MPAKPVAPTDAAARAASDLARVQAKVEAARAVLVRLLQDVVVAESRLDNSEAARLLEANEQLVEAALRHRLDADTAAQALDEVERMAERDPLTELPNRVLLLDRMAHAVLTAKRNGTRLALLFLDLDHIKQINDALGHAVGDQVLKLVARRLTASVREADTVSRHGGDEFLLLLATVDQRADAALVANKVITALRAPSRIGAHVLRLQASIGISLYPDDADEPDLLVERADAAMYRAKNRGHGGFAFYDEAPEGADGTPVSPPAVWPKPLTPYELALAEVEQRQAHLREANEQLVLAALSARDLQTAAERAQQRQAEFMALVAQELNNPLAPIRVAMAVLGRADGDEPLLPRVQSLVEQQLENLARLVRAVQAVSAAQAAPLNPGTQVVDMAGVIAAAVDHCRAVIDLRRQRLDLQLPAGAMPVRGDPQRLTQLVCNVLDNASKHTPQGGAITLQAALADGSLVLTVSDNGIGITAQALPHLFAPFVQDMHAIGFNGVGVGIGLAVVRALVQALGGSVVASSDGSGRGSRFVVTLPLAQPVTAAQPVTTAPSVTPAPPGTATQPGMPAPPAPAAPQPRP